MCEVTNYNFEKLYHQIVDVLKQAVFVSVDCEFSSLFIKNEYKGSLFDTPSERYSKLRKNMERAIPLEIGLTAFTFNREKAMYLAKLYKFYVFPANLELCDKIFTCQSSGFHFLGEHNFDFNKVIYSGISYLNKTEEKEIKKFIEEDTLYDYSKNSLDFIKYLKIQNDLSLLSEWFHSKKEENIKIICDINFRNYSVIYLLHKEIRKRFPEQVWTFEEDEKLKVKRVSPEEYKLLNAEMSLDQTFLTSLLGFTRIYRQLISLKKPIVGHNFLSDIILLMNTFENPIPKSYTAFKKQANKSFPAVFDTKTLSFEMRNLLSDETKWSGNGLQELYEYFKNEKGRHLVPNSPRIEISDEFKTYTDDKFHDAGWDAYCTGYCFIRIAHFYAAKAYESCTQKSFLSTEHLKAVEEFKNRVNIIRATTSYLNLSGADPESQRPPCLIIQSTNSKPVDIFKMTELFRVYGSVDIRPFSCKGRRAIVAVANYRSARRILGHFQNHDEFQVVMYNSIKHSPIIRAALWSGTIASTSILAWLIHTQFLK